MRSAAPLPQALQQHLTPKRRAVQPSQAWHAPGWPLPRVRRPQQHLQTPNPTAQCGAAWHAAKALTQRLTQPVRLARQGSVQPDAAQGCASLQHLQGVQAARKARCVARHHQQGQVRVWQPVHEVPQAFALAPRRWPSSRCRLLPTPRSTCWASQTGRF